VVSVECDTDDHSGARANAHPDGHSPFKVSHPGAYEESDK
jgi:hypothetical protein